jgi:hypothetical protein
MFWFVIPGFSLRSNPGLELANASGVFQTKTTTKPTWDELTD